MSPARRKSPEDDDGSFVDFGQTAQMADPAVSALLNQSERRRADAHLPKKAQEKKLKERQKTQRRSPGHTTYDIPVALRKRIAEMAEREGLPASQIAALALLRIVADLESGALDLGAYKVASRSPRFDFILNLPLEALDGVERRPRKGR